jgi:transposase
LRSQGVEQVAMESTGVYGWPVFNILEEQGIPAMVVNAERSKGLPGRKTDVRDCEWLADLLRHGLVEASFIPPAAIRNLRELTRYRTAQVQARTAEVNRLQKVLESANIKLAAVASDVLGVSGRQMLQGLQEGQADAEVLADLAQGVLRHKREELRLALEGRVQPHHRLLIGEILGHIAYREQTIARLDQEIARLLTPFQAAVALLQTVPGIGEVAAAAILAEIGLDMSRFHSAAHLASWAGVCPGNHESAGRRRGSKGTHGNRWLRGILGEVAWAAIKEKDTAFGARYRRLVGRCGPQKALVAVMHHLLTVIYSVLRDQTPYRELGPDYYRPKHPERVQRRLVERLEALRFTVSLTPKEAA